MNNVTGVIAFGAHESYKRKSTEPIVLVNPDLIKQSSGVYSFTVGKAHDTNAMVFHDVNDSISRNHLNIQVDTVNGEITLTDQSMNGSSVLANQNAFRLEPSVLAENTFFLMYQNQGATLKQLQKNIPFKMPMDQPWSLSLAGNQGILEYEPDGSLSLKHVPQALEDRRGRAIQQAVPLGILKFNTPPSISTDATTLRQAAMTRYKSQ